MFAADVGAVKRRIELMFPKAKLTDEQIALLCSAVGSAPLTVVVSEIDAHRLSSKFNDPDIGTIARAVQARQVRVGVTESELVRERRAAIAAYARAEDARMLRDRERVAYAEAESPEAGKLERMRQQEEYDWEMQRRNPR